MSLITLALRLTLCWLALFAATSAEDPAPVLTADERREAIRVLAGHLKSSYVFPDVAEKMVAAVEGRAREGAYEALSDPEAFALAVTGDLQAVSHDKHMRVRAEGVPEKAASRRPRFPRNEEEMRRRNFGFEKVEVLPGNVGYLDLRLFAPAELAGDTVAAAMNFLANTDALVVDLRQNGGGQPEMVQLFCSYLFGPEPVHLNDLYFRPRDETRQFWTLASLPGKRYLDRDVYVLTSRDTFSGAEECAYNLKTQQRASIVGERTGGGANPGGQLPLTAHLAAFVPTGRAINPITGTNWEGTGVEPDVEVPADLALAKALELAASKAGRAK